MVDSPNVSTMMLGESTKYIYHKKESILYTGIIHNMSSIACNVSPIGIVLVSRDPSNLGI